MTVVTEFWVNYVAPKPSKNGDYLVLMNPVGDVPDFQRLEGRTSVTWQLWLKSAEKASEYRNLVDQASVMHLDPKTGKPKVGEPLRRLHVQFPCTIRVKPGMTADQQSNVLTLTGPAVKEIRVFTPPTSNDDFA